MGLLVRSILRSSDALTEDFNLGSTDPSEQASDDILERHMVIHPTCQTQIPISSNDFGMVD